jgi:hypothetical protein
MAIALKTSSNVVPGQNTHLLNQWPFTMMDAPPHWHFNQCAGTGAPVQTTEQQAGIIYLQSEREYIARTLQSAADRMAADLNYYICPAYFTETIPLGRGIPIQAQVFQARYCKMIELGKRAQTLIQAGVAVTYSDPNSVGVNDTATITVNTTVANSEIALYFQVADGAPTAGDYRYEIEPLQVTDNGAGQVTIVAPRPLFVKPSQWARETALNDPNYKAPNVVDTATAAGFVTAVDVYRVYTDTSDNIELLSADGTLLQTYTGDIIDNELSAFRMGDLCSNVCWDKWPQRIKVNYHAGSPLVNSMIDNELFEACCAFSAAKMRTTLTRMSYWTLETWKQYNEPMVITTQGRVIPIATQAQANNPYGARAGEVLAWDVVSDRRIIKGHKFF